MTGTGCQATAWLVTERVRYGDLYWVDFSPTQGREQHGTRPALVVSSSEYLQSVPDLLVVLPVTSVDRGWPHHVQLRGAASALPKSSFAMTEQPRTVSRDRLARHSGHTDDTTMAEVAQWLRDSCGCSSGDCCWRPGLSPQRAQVDASCLAAFLLTRPHAPLGFATTSTCADSCTIVC